MSGASLRREREALVADRGRRGVAFGQALAGLLDETLATHAVPGDLHATVAVVALGSYARRELCPGSDVDVLLLHGPTRRHNVVRELAELLWYPLWDAGFVTGHAARTVKQSLNLAESDLDALTAILETRHVAGDASLTAALVDGDRRLAQRRATRVVTLLASAAETRWLRPGPVAEMLEPDLKEGAGGLRDLQALEWAGWCLDGPAGPGGLAGLEARGFVSEDDAARLRAARRHLLDLRVALHRITGGRADRLLLQEQDAVAALLGSPDADALVRATATTAREVAWVARDTWDRLRTHFERPPGRLASADRPLFEGVVLRDGRVHLADARPARALTVLEAAAAAAELGASFDRESLRRLRGTPTPSWDVWERAAFLRLLRAGAAAIPVFEALDHEGVLVRLLPEWEHVRSLPQRNAYHRHTVDRHLLEAVAECVRLLDAGDAEATGEPDFDAVVARACRRPELLLLAALLHDVGKGFPQHWEAGADVALDVARRIGLDREGREIVAWLVLHHLVLADTATRRDLADEAVVDNLVDLCARDAERLRLLYLLTIGDSRATGPAAWSAPKAVLVRELFTKAAAAIEQGAAANLTAERRAALAGRLGAEAAEVFLARLPLSYPLAFEPDTMVAHHAMLGERETLRVVETGADERIVVTVVAPDRPGLLATLAGALTVGGLTVSDASLFSTSDGMALDVFVAADPYGRFTERGPARVDDALRRALAGELDVAAGVRQRRQQTYRHPRALRPPSGPVNITVDLEASDRATVVEVNADDQVGLLYQLAATFADLDCDVTRAKVATLGDRVVDVFYVRDAGGAKITDRLRLDQLRATLLARLTAETAGE